MKHAVQQSRSNGERYRATSPSVDIQEGCLEEVMWWLRSII
jgi:hypothetical protein